MYYFKKISLLLSTILLAVIIYISIALIEQGHVAKAYKVDYATLHSGEYGMFNSDVWTAKVIQVIDKRIEKFNLDSDNREEVKGYIQTIIDTLVLEAERVVKERNRGKRGFFESIVGSTKQMITDTIIDFKDLRKRVPEFTDTVMIEVEKPENQARAKKLIREKIQQFISGKFELTTDMTPYYTVIQKYGAKDLETANRLLDTKMLKLSSTMNGMMELILGLSFLLILFILIQNTLNTISLLLLTGTTITLLGTGIMLPMLDIEAKISKLYFIIMDHPILFENQILFFQTKSISDLVKLLLDSGEGKMILVGVLLTMFSIIFPTLKLISTAMYFYGNSIITNNPITRFFALKSTKWSMADVMVVSIFMAYLGLDGVVSSELKHLESSSEQINIITTNGTHLEIGFYLFLGFVLTSFVLSILVEKYKKL
jgi:hypothetical protein